MLLRFYAKHDELVREPGVRLIVGHRASYVGRKFDEKTNGFPATAEPFAVSAESAEGQRLATLCQRDGSLWPADEATAQACGVPFQPVEFQSGAWVAAATKTAAKTAKNAKE